MPEDIFIGEHQNKLAQFYNFFVSQEQYSPTLHILPEKFSEFQDDFEKILARYQKSAWRQKIYLNLIRRNPSAEWTYIAKLKSIVQSFDVAEYNELIDQVNSFETAISLFAEMKQAGLMPNYISYNTLIKKCQTYEQGIKLLTEMKQTGFWKTNLSGCEMNGRRFFVKP